MLHQCHEYGEKEKIHARNRGKFKGKKKTSGTIYDHLRRFFFSFTFTKIFFSFTFTYIGKPKYYKRIE